MSPIAEATPDPDHPGVCLHCGRTIAENPMWVYQDRPMYTHVKVDGNSCVVDGRVLRIEEVD